MRARWAALFVRSRLWRRRSARTPLIIGIAVGSLSACAGIERGRYGISRFELSGMHEMNPRTLGECLLTREREPVAIRLGVRSPECGEPPFDRSRPELRLWTWGWTDWPSFNRGVLDRDLERILRWYRARGFYSARIESVSFDPPEAARGEACRGGDCRLQVHVALHEGSPVLVDEVELEGVRGLPRAVVLELEGALQLARGERFDESAYDRSKSGLRRVLREAGYAGAKLKGSVDVSTRAGRASVRFVLTPGPAYRVGAVRVAGHGRLPEQPIRAAAGLIPGEPYRPLTLRNARADVMGLGAFSSVTMDEKLNRDRASADVTIRVVPRSNDELEFGFGVMSGTNYRDAAGDLSSIPQWDVHLLGRYERRHIFGTLGSLRVEERPRLIFGRAFPDFTSPDLGNIVSAELTQPGLVEAKTNLSLRGSWDYGPDPFLGFVRSDVILRLEAQRSFLERRLSGTLAVQQDLFLVDEDAANTTSDGSPTPESYRLSFLEQELRLDLRDQVLQPSKGAYLALRLAESPRAFISDWTALAVGPEARVYGPLPFDSVIAARFAVAALIIAEASESLDDLSRRLGPSNYRLRGGGANSVRGFLPGELGVGSQGGIRRWEGMLEWRVRLGSSLTTVLFVDFGDVNDESSFRFSQLNTSVGLGVRYFSFIGPLRLDAGFRIMKWQSTDGSASPSAEGDDFPFTDVPGALHLTIGDSF